MQQNLTEIKDLIIKGKIDKALQVLEEIKTSDHIKKRIHLQCSRFRINKTHQFNHDLAHEKIEIENNQIIESLLDIIDSIENNTPLEKFDEAVLKKSWGKKIEQQISQLSGVTLLGICFSGIGFILILVAHTLSRERLLHKETFWIGAFLLLASFMIFAFSRFRISPEVLSSFHKNKSLNQDLQILFMHLIQVLRNAHDFSSSHIKDIEYLLESINSNKETDAETVEKLKNKINDLKAYSSMAGLFDNTMHIMENIEYAIVQSNFKEIKSYSDQLKKIPEKIQELM